MTQRQLKLITFDLDDTLWDMYPVLRRAEQRVREWADQHCPALYQRHTRHDFMRIREELLNEQPELCHQISHIRVEMMRRALERSGYSADEAVRLAEEGFEVFIAARHDVELFEEAEDCLAELSQHYTLGVLTNGNADIYRLGLGHYFAFAYSAEQLNASKPSAEVFRAALEAVGVTPSEMLHVGDHVDHDITGAQDIGAATVWINASEEPWPYARRPDAEVSHIGEVPAAIERIEAGLSRHT